jgi:hypothetical protein
MGDEPLALRLERSPMLCATIGAYDLPLTLSGSSVAVVLDEFVVVRDEGALDAVVGAAHDAHLERRARSAEGSASDESPVLPGDPRLPEAFRTSRRVPERRVVLRRRRIPIQRRAV